MKDKKKKDDNLICFIIERDDCIGIKRLYFDKTKSLEMLLKYILEVEAITDAKKRRIRK